MRLIFLCLNLISVCPLNAQISEYEHKDYKIEKNFKFISEPLDLNYPRKINHIDASEAVIAADKFLKSVWGVKFTPHIVSISLKSFPGGGENRFWCWTIAYHDVSEDDGIRERGYFYVYISIDGSPLMKVTKLNKIEK